MAIKNQVHRGDLGLPDGDVAKLQLGPRFGAVELSAGGRFVYTPLFDFTGVDYFVYSSGGVFSLFLLPVEDGEEPPPPPPPDVELRDMELTVDYGQSYVVLPSQLFEGEAQIDSVTGAELRDGVVVLTAETQSFTYSVGNQSATVTIKRSGVPHEGDPRHDEHMALHAKVAGRQAATVAAIQNGVWSNPRVWNTGRVPGAGDRVLIHDTAKVVYDQQSDERLAWVRVDGGLSFTPGTKLTVETLVGTSGSQVIIGSGAAPIPDDEPVSIVIDTSGGPLDLEADPKLLGRGVLVHGRTRIRGWEKTAYVALEEDAHAGDESLLLADEPGHWRPGDTVLIASTSGDTDEFHVISDIDMRTVWLEEPLSHHHTRPTGETFEPEELEVHVANVTRSVRFTTTNPGVPAQERAHMMVMHSKDTVLEAFSVEGFGRTDKSRLIDDVPGDAVNGADSHGTNPRGRYGIHLHRTGSKSDPIYVNNCVVLGSPGWGIVQHNSGAELTGNIVYDAFGAAFVQEGDHILGARETGVWDGNLAIRSRAGGHDNFDDKQFLGDGGRSDLFDMGFFGTGYWLQGGGTGIEFRDNVAVNCNVGVDVFSTTFGLREVRTVKLHQLSNEAFVDSLLARGYALADSIRTHHVPMQGIEGLQVYNSRRGILVWLHNKTGALRGRVHDFYSQIDGYTLWNVRQGITNFYSSQMRFGDGLIIGDPKNPIPNNHAHINNQFGSGVQTNSHESHAFDFDRLRIEGFEFGIMIPPASDEEGLVYEEVSRLSDAQFANVRQAFRPMHIHEPFTKLFEIHGLEASVLDEAEQPLAEFEATVSGNAVHLDASGSQGHGYVNRANPGNAIAAYRWEIDGQTRFGEHLDYEFGASGAHEINLTVWDSLGQPSQTSQTVQIAESE